MLTVSHCSINALENNIKLTMMLCNKKLVKVASFSCILSSDQIFREALLDIIKQPVSSYIMLFKI